MENLWKTYGNCVINGFCVVEMVRIRQTRRFLHLVRDTLSFRCYARFGDQCQQECSRAVRLIAPSGAIE